MPLTHKIVIGAACIGLTATLAFAGGHAKGKFANEVGARQAQMKLYAFNLGILGAMAKGEMDYDAELAAQSAANLQAAASMSMAAAWPQGSDSESIQGTRALPAIWQNFPDVGAKGQAMGAAVATMASAAGEGLDALRGAIGPLGQSCGGCHKPYRAPDS